MRHPQACPQRGWMLSLDGQSLASCMDVRHAPDADIVKLLTMDEALPNLLAKGD